MTWRDTGAGETRLAIQNALKLGASLIFTWGIALAVRFWLPRHLGPARFGALCFAEAFAGTCFLTLGLGLDAYIRKEIPVRPAHAGDFFGGALVLRAGMATALLGVMTIAMLAMGNPPEVRRVIYLFALAQLFVTLNATLSALLQAQGSVGGMSMLAIATKIVWALGVLLAVMTGVGLAGVALAYVASEAMESVALFLLARRHLGLPFRVDVEATRAVVVLSLPNYVTALATTAYGRLDMTLLTLAGSSREVGWYGAAAAIAGLSLFLSPLLGWVLMPTLARASARSREDLLAQTRRSMELVLVVAIPAALFVYLASDLAVRLLFGEAFAPAGLALRILAPTFVFTYVAIILSITLFMLDRAWTLACISLAGVAVNLLLNLALVPPAMARAGDGGGGAGCALSMLGTEVFVSGAMMGFVGRAAFDRRTVLTALKCLAACALVVVLDHLSLPIGWARLALDLGVYVLVVVATDAVRPVELARALLSALRRRRAEPRPATVPDAG